jgi:hypothetical protein
VRSTTISAPPERNAAGAKNAAGAEKEAGTFAGKCQPPFQRQSATNRVWSVNKKQKWRI